MAAGSGSIIPSLNSARALLRIARDIHHIDSRTGQLSRSRVLLQDLRGEPVTGNPGKCRSFSTYMLCNQTPEVVLNIAAEVAKEPSFIVDPKGAGALCSDLERIDSGGVPALLVSEEEDKDGRPGHVGIRFARHVANAGEAEQRRVRDALIAVFGAVASVAQVHKRFCV